MSEHVRGCVLRVFSPTCGEASRPKIAILGQFYFLSNLLYNAADRLSSVFLIFLHIFSFFLPYDPEGKSEERPRRLFSFYYMCAWRKCFRSHAFFEKGVAPSCRCPVSFPRRFGTASSSLFGEGLTFCGSCTFIANKGIVLNPGSHLIVWGQSGGSGTLKAYGESYRAGIGGYAGDWDNIAAETGNLTINGGKIVASGGKGAPGLGSGTTDSGIITINGGTVTAYGSEAYVDSDGTPGIGTGSGTMNDVYFYGGTTTVNGGYDSDTHYY